MKMKKTKCIGIGEEPEDQELHIRKIKRCKEYKYLGSSIWKGTSRKDIYRQIQQVRRCMLVLNSLLWFEKNTLKTKMTLYRAVVEPNLIYGAECWQLTENDKKSIETTEIEERALAQIETYAERRNKTNIMTKRVYISVGRIETRHLVWYEHVMRMGKERWTRRALEYTPST